MLVQYTEAAAAGGLADNLTAHNHESISLYPARVTAQGLRDVESLFVRDVWNLKNEVGEESSRSRWRHRRR